jgi:homospermidine synthase
MNERKILFIGYGAIAQALTPVLFDRFPDLKRHNVSAISADERGAAVAHEYGIDLTICALTRENLDAVLDKRLGAGDIMLNLSVEVSTLALIDWCQARHVMYLDTCVEPWAGGYDAAHRPLIETTNYWLRKQALRRKGKGRSTCVIAHGANPGLVSHFVKMALARLAAAHALDVDLPCAAQARALGIKTVHITERDTQADNLPLQSGEFANTWSVDGLLAEGMQRAELSWGTHEAYLPAGARRHDGSADAGLILDSPGARTKVVSWTPSVGEQDAYLITHHEALSIGDLLTESEADGTATYRPTVYYAYRPTLKTCESMCRWAHHDFAPPAVKTILRDELASGADELGILLMHERDAYWFGSVLSLAQARHIAPYNSATTMQVVGGIVGAIEWMTRNPHEGVVEAEDMDSECVVRAARPFLGEVFGTHTNWRANGMDNLQTVDFLRPE